MQTRVGSDLSYRLYTLSDRGVITGAQSRSFASDHEALGHAKVLLGSHFGVELWQTDRLVGRVERPADGPRP